MSTDYSWSTEDELEFLYHLSTHSCRQQFTLQDLMKKYLESIDVRVNWGRMDKEIIRNYVLSVVNREV